ncbi:MAG: hypothetical protein ABSA27_09095 [Terriglobales bacterium]|jgi:hypothetical protein
MSISGILSSSFLQNQLSSVNSPNQQDMQKLSQDLQSGNLSAAQSDFATLQQAYSQSATTPSASTTSTSSSAAQAFNQLASDLQSGNLSAAQKDFSTAQKDFPDKYKIPPYHFHVHTPLGGGGGGSGSSNQNSLLQDLNQVGQNLTSSNLAGAQQGYATLQQELQQFALVGGTRSSTLLAQMPVSIEA